VGLLSCGLVLHAMKMLWSYWNTQLVH